MDKLTKDRVAKLLDELLRHGVPLILIEYITDWMKKQ